MGYALKSGEWEWVPFEHYLAAELESDQRHEYVAGAVYAMAGASERHNTIVQSLGSAIEQVLPTRCRVWQSDMKLRIDLNGDHYSYYPDIMAACSVNSGDPYSRTDPLLVVEVLSPSTQRIDLGEKRDHYRSIDSLQEYLVVQSERPLVQLFRRENSWREERLGVGAVLRLESVGLELPVEAIYRRVRAEVGLT